MHNDGIISSSGEHYGYSASEQFQNRPFDSLNNESNFVSAFQIAEAENEMLRGTPADTEAVMTPFFQFSLLSLLDVVSTWLGFTSYFFPSLVFFF